MNPESIDYLFEVGIKGKQEDYIWPISGDASVNDRVFIVCDGAGSFNNGEIASEMIGRFMAAKVLKFGEQKMSGELIDKLLVEARDRLITYARVSRLDTDLATTFSMLILYDQKVLISWYGDSPVYHLRDGQIVFKSEDNSIGNELKQNAATTRGIKADSSPINAETKWIEDVRDGDYFLLCSKGLMENVTDDDIKLLVSQNDKENIDLTGSFRRLTFGKTSDNYSMYLIRVNVGKQKRGKNSGTIATKKQTSGIVSQIIILSMTIVGLLLLFFYFRGARTSGPSQKSRNRTTQPVEVLRNDSVPNAIVISAPRKQPGDVLRDDSVPNAIVISTPRKPIPPVTDSVKSKTENPPLTPPADNSAVIQADQKPEQTNKGSVGEKKRMAQLLIKFTTDESCKLKITNMDLDEVIDWDLSQYDNGTIYLKPGKYSIVATSVLNSSKTKTYNFDVKPGNSHTTQNLNVKF